MKRFLFTVSALILATVGILFAAHDANKPTKVESRPTSSKVQTPPKPQPPKLVTDEEIETKLNEYRLSQGLPALADSLILDTAAQARAEGVCADNNWSHNGSWAVLSQYYVYRAAGENLYYGGLRNNQADDVVSGWIASPSHLENIVGDYSEIGIGVKQCPGFQGAADAVIVTNYFGVPR